MSFSCSGGGYIGLFAFRPPGGHANLFAMVFENLVPIPITMPNFKNLSLSARFHLYMAYSSPANQHFVVKELRMLALQFGYSCDKSLWSGGVTIQSVTIWDGFYQAAKIKEIDFHLVFFFQIPLRWRHNGHDCVSNHQPHHCLLNCLFGRRSK